jgi:hypothetical protein
VEVSRTMGVEADGFVDELFEGGFSSNGVAINE